MKFDDFYTEFESFKQELTELFGERLRQDKDNFNSNQIYLWKATICDKKIEAIFMTKKLSDSGYHITYFTDFTQEIVDDEKIDEIEYKEKLISGKYFD